MSQVESLVVRSSPWRAFAGGVVLPWALREQAVAGDGLEVGCGSGAIAARLLDRFASLHLTATDYDPKMVLAAERLIAVDELAREISRLGLGASTIDRGPLHAFRFSLVV